LARPVDAGRSHLAVNVGAHDFLEDGRVLLDVYDDLHWPSRTFLHFLLNGHGEMA
jgi:hypothetical protein